MHRRHNVNLNNVVYFVAGIIICYALCTNLRLNARVDVKTFNRQNSTNGSTEEMCKSAQQLLRSATRTAGISEAERLAKQVRVLCWVMTSPANFKKKGAAVRDTWGKRCTLLLYMSENTSDVSNASVIGLDVKPGREHLNDKTMKAFEYIYKYHLNDADWFLKADDDTYVVLENLRVMLSAHDSTKPSFFGQHFQAVGRHYFSGGAGYVISKGALEIFGKKDQKHCVRNSVYEDLALAECLKSLGISMQDSRDAAGKGRFHCFNPKMHLEGKYPDWYYGHNQDDKGAYGISGMSEHSISFHYISPLDMYLLEFLIYHVHPYGLNYDDRNINPTPAASKYKS